MGGPLAPAAGRRIALVGRRIVLAGLAALACPSAGAIETVSLELGTFAGHGVTATGVTLTYALAGAEPSAVLRADTLELPEPAGRIRHAELRCGRLRVESGRLDCRDGRLSVVHPALSRIAGPVSLGIDLATRRIDAKLSKLRLADGIVSLDLSVAAGRTSLSANLDGNALHDLVGLLANSGVALPGGLAPTGRVSGSINIELAPGTPRRIRANLALSDVSMSGFDDRLAGAGLGLSVELGLGGPGAGSPLQLRVSATAGEIYADPVYLDLNLADAVLGLDGRWHDDSGRLDIETGSFRRGATLALTGKATIQPGGEPFLASAEIDLGEAVLPDAYGEWLRPWLIGTAFDSLETLGSLRGRVSIRDDDPIDVDLDVTGVAMRDANKRFALSGVRGRVRWNAHADPPGPGTLSWDAGQLYGITIGPTSAAWSASGNRLSLNEPMRVPVLDGALDVRVLAVRGAGGDDPSVDFDAELEPVGLAALTAAVGWPRFGGTLSGNLPSLRYEGGNLTLGGTLMARVFDGRVTVDALRIEQPLGVLPVLTADVRLRNLDLMPLTEAFSFGRIEGRLDGDVADLRMLGWKPVRFDARFYTPANDRSRRRISQRAIENISSIGGFGSAASLSGIALALFDDFGYERIDISCRLRDEVCRMGGIDASGEGYYIVKGRGLPRIDVIGYSSNVNWPTLVQRLGRVGDRAPQTAPTP